MEKKPRYFVIAHMGAEFRRKNPKKHEVVEGMLREKLKVKYGSALETVVGLMTEVEVRLLSPDSQEIMASKRWERLSFNL